MLVGMEDMAVVVFLTPRVIFDAKQTRIPTIKYIKMLIMTEKVEELINFDAADAPKSEEKVVRNAYVTWLFKPLKKVKVNIPAQRMAQSKGTVE